jgi:hypothetical protein
MYVLNLLSLWVARKITWATVRYAMKSRPVAVAGRGGSYQVDAYDPNFLSGPMEVKMTKDAEQALKLGPRPLSPTELSVHQEMIKRDIQMGVFFVDPKADPASEK